MQSHLLDGARAKIERAKEHILNLNDEITALLRSDAYSVVGENQPKRQRYVFRVEGQPIPLRLSVIAGEVVHQLRSSLDLIVYELAGLGYNKDRLRTKFPVCGTRKKFKASIKEGAIEGVPSEARELIEALQPYRSDDPRNSVIQMVHELDIRDKHKLLVVVTTAMRMGHVLEVDGGDAPITIHLPSAKTQYALHRGTENGREIQWVSYTTKPGNEKIEMKVDFTIHMAFDKVGATKLPEVIPSLTVICERMEGIVGRFDEFF